MIRYPPSYPKCGVKSLLNGVGNQSLSDLRAECHVTHSEFTELIPVMILLARPLEIHSLLIAWAALAWILEPIV